MHGHSFSWLAISWQVLHKTFLEIRTQINLLGKGMTLGTVWEIKAPTYGPLGPVSRKSRKLFGPEKPFVKLWPAYSVKLVFSYVVKGIKIKITAKFRASRRLSFEDTKRIMSPETRPKSFGTFEKQAPGPDWIPSFCLHHPTRRRLCHTLLFPVLYESLHRRCLLMAAYKLLFYPYACLRYKARWHEPNSDVFLVKSRLLYVWLVD